MKACFQISFQTEGSYLSSASGVHPFSSPTYYLWENLFLGKAGCNYVQSLTPSYLFTMAFASLSRTGVSSLQTPMNFCNKRLRYSREGLYQIAQLDTKTFTLSSTKYHENRTHTSSGRTSVINVYVACS